MTGRLSILLALLAAAVLGGCTYLADDHGQAVSLRQYDVVVVDSVQAERPADAALCPALTEMLERDVAASGEWETPGLRQDARIVKLRVRLLGAGAGRDDPPDSGAAAGLAIRSLVTVHDKEGKQLGHVALTARGSAPTPEGCAACRRQILADLSRQVVRALGMAKLSSRKWDTATMGCGC